MTRIAGACIGWRVENQNSDCGLVDLPAILGKDALRCAAADLGCSCSAGCSQNGSLRIAAEFSTEQEDDLPGTGQIGLGQCLMHCSFDEFAARVWRCDKAARNFHNNFPL